MLRFPVTAILSIALVACGGGNGESVPAAGVPADAAAIDARLKSDMLRVAPLVANLQASFLYIMNPGSPLAQGVNLVQDSSPSAAPNTYVFSGTYDGNGDGFNESTLNGRVTFATDPALGWSSAVGRATLDIGIPLLGHVYGGTVDFSVTSAEIRLSGAGTFTNPLSGSTTRFSVPADTPLVVKPAAVDAVANACGFSLSGDIGIQVKGATGTLNSSWLFEGGSSTAAIHNATFLDPAGESTTLPDSSADLRCGGNGTSGDWVAAYDQQWVCLPRESGRARITISATGPSSIAISDEDPPGSGQINSHDATIVGASPHAVQGFFIGGPAGSRYREDFTWTLLKDGSFSQYSAYRYFEGAGSGSGGICSAKARRVP